MSLISKQLLRAHVFFQGLSLSSMTKSGLNDVTNVALLLQRRKSCSRKRRPCKRLTKKFCHRRERKCRSRMSMPCRQSPGCSRRTNKRCRRKYDKCIDSYRTPVNTERPHHVNDPRHFPLIKQPILPERKKEKQPCRVTSDCQDGLCCAQYGVGRRICQSFTKKDQVCTRTFDRKRSVETYERCPCEVGLTCMSTPKLKHHYTCQGAWGIHIWNSERNKLGATTTDWLSVHKIMVYVGRSRLLRSLLAEL